MNGLGVQALEPPKRVKKVVTGPPVPSMEELQLAQVAKALREQETAQIHLTVAGAVGVALLCAAGYLIVGRR